MTLADYLTRKIPEYYDGMHRDGFTPQEILTAAHKKMIQEFTSADPHTAADPFQNIKIKSEIKIK